MLLNLFFFFFAGFPPQSSLSHIKIGDKVRVKPTITTPKYKWGSVTHRSVGVVKGKPWFDLRMQTKHMSI